MQIESDHDRNFLDLSSARHVAAHVVSQVHFGLCFESVAITTISSCRILESASDADSGIRARIALAGPCMDLAVDLVEDEGEYPPTLGWLETWRDDVVAGEGAYRDDMLATQGGAADAAAWSLAFCRANFALIEEAATMLIHGSGNVSHAAFAARLGGRTVNVDAAALAAADEDLIGGSMALEAIDAAVSDHITSKG